MSTLDAVPDRDELRRRAEARYRRLWSLTVGYLVVAGGMGLLFSLNVDHRWTIAQTIVAIVTAVLIVMVVLLMRFVRGRNPGTLLMGADRRTQRAVRAAFKT